MFVARPTKQQLQWYDLEFGVLIHYLPIQDGELIIANIHGDLTTYDPPRLDPEQWVRSAWKAGAKYAVLVAKQCSFAAWPTEVNDCSIASAPWKEGKGDVVREFVDACRKYGILPGLYYHTTRNDYYHIDNLKTYDYKGEMYQAYVRCVEKQLTELMTGYGDIFEFWFDTGLIPPEEGGPDVLSLLRHYQPDALAFQGPPQWINNIRWVGNEDGVAPKNCWSATFAGESRFDGSVPDEPAGRGDPDGWHFWPAEADVPNRNGQAEAGGWNWRAGEEHTAYSPDNLMQFYLETVGRNANLLIGMAITEDGLFEDEEQLAAFGECLRETFGETLVRVDSPVPVNGCVTVRIPAGRRASYLVVREDITEGQRIRRFSVEMDGKPFCELRSLGHKRIVKLPEDCFDSVTVRVLEAAGDWKLRDMILY